MLHRRHHRRRWARPAAGRTGAPAPSGWRQLQRRAEEESPDGRRKTRRRDGPDAAVRPGGRQRQFRCSCAALSSSTGSRTGAQCTISDPEASASSAGHPLKGAAWVVTVARRGREGVPPQLGNGVGALLRWDLADAAGAATAPALYELRSGLGPWRRPCATRSRLLSSWWTNMPSHPLVGHSAGTYASARLGGSGSGAPRRPSAPTPALVTARAAALHGPAAPPARVPDIGATSSSSGGDSLHAARSCLGDRCPDSDSAQITTQCPSTRALPPTGLRSCAIGRTGDALDPAGRGSAVTRGQPASDLAGVNSYSLEIGWGEQPASSPVTARPEVASSKVVRTRRWSVPTVSTSATSRPTSRPSASRARTTQ